MAIALAPALMANQCFKLIDIRVAPDPAAGDAPSFSFAYDGERLSVVKSFEVSGCPGGRWGRMWRIVPDGRTQHPGEPLRITYGRPPRGYREEVPAQPLAPGGCYRAQAEGIGLPALNFGGETFRILPSGRMVAGQPGGFLTSSTPFRQLNRAAVGCARGFRRAGTAADSARVQAREYPVAGERLSCGWLLESWPDVMSEPITTERGVLAVIAAVATIAGFVLFGQLLPDAS